MDYKYYSLDLKQLSDLKSKIKAKRVLSGLQRSRLENSFTLSQSSMPFGEEETGAVEALRELGFEVEWTVDECSCGYCDDCHGRVYDALPEEDKSILKIIEDNVAKLSNDARSYYHSGIVPHA